MKNTFKKILGAVSSLAIISTIAISSVSAAENGNEMVYYNGNIAIFSNDKADYGITQKRDFIINYVVDTDVCYVTSEYLGLPSDCSFVKSTTAENTFSVAVQDEETLNNLFDSAKTLLDDGKILNAYKQMTYNHTCIFGINPTIVLKEENSDFNPNSYSGLENFTFVKSESNPKEYTCNSTNVLDYITFTSAGEEILADENVASFYIPVLSCAVDHERTLVTYLNYTPENVDPIVVKGDANGDNMLNVRDATYIARNIAQGNELPASADFNDDGVVNVRDAAAIARYLATKSE
jgi:hypothetical protein